MLEPDKYWDWFWTDAYYRLLFGLPLFAASVIWAVIKYWDEIHEDDPPKQHFTELRTK